MKETSHPDRRGFLRGLVATAALPALAPRGSASGDRPNILMITADDLNQDSSGCYGCRVRGITPHIDSLAAQGLAFERGHATVAVCQPGRSVWTTGRYPHRNGALGFEPIREDVPTLQEQLRKAGYLNGILGKVRHLAPRRKFCWDVAVGPKALGQGRDPARYLEETKRFLGRARKEGRPFFLMANSHDPHRPFAGSLQERRWERRRKIAHPRVRRVIRPDEVEVPGFLPDLPGVRQEVAEYFTSVHRFDETVGAILRALEESGLAERTLVMLLSDHGMPFPFAKTNCYLHSTRIPWIVRWPGRVKPGRRDRDHFVSGIDLMPTLLEAAALPHVDGMDGRSFLPLLEGRLQEGRDELLTVFHMTSARRRYPMRCLHQGRFGYIWNPWSDGKTVFRNESQSGRTFKAMQAAARSNPAIAARVRLFRYRLPEELYDFQADPDALKTLVLSKEHQATLKTLRTHLHRILAKIGDPLAG